MSATPFDELDLRIVEALQVSGRATAARIGDVLGLAERTVARRLQRLLADGSVRVVRMKRITDLPAGAVALRVKVLRGKAVAIAEALARRPDVLFVDVHLGGDEISALATPTAPSSKGFLLDQLPLTSAITSWTVQALVHVFADASQWRIGHLSHDEQAALESGVGDNLPVTHDTTDQILIRELDRDARQPIAQLAARTNASEATVRRHLDRLVTAGDARTVCIVDAARCGYPIDANVTMCAPPSLLDAIGRTLSADPRVHGLFASTGSTNLQGAFFCRDRDDLYAFMTETLGPLGLSSVEVALVEHAVKRAGVPYPPRRTSGPI